MDFYSTRYDVGLHINVAKNSGVGGQNAIVPPIVMETPTEIIIDGVAHDKVTLAPTFLRRLDYWDYALWSPFIFNRFWTRNPNLSIVITDTSYWTYHRPDGDSSSVKKDGGAGIVKQVWQSQYDPDVFYIMGQMCRNYILKVSNKTNLPMLPMWTSGPNSGGSNEGWYERGQCFYHEDQNYIYHMAENQLYPTGSWTDEATYAMWAYPWNRVNKINLQDWTNSGIYITKGVVQQLMLKTTQSAFFSFNGTYMTACGRHVLAVHPLMSGVQTNILTIDGATYHHFPEPSFCRQATGKASTIKDYYIVQGNGSTGWFHRRVEVNIDGPSAVKTECTMDFAGAGFAAADMPCLSSNNRCVAIRCFTVIGTTKEYMGWAYTEKSGNSTEPANRFNIYLFQIDAADRNILHAKQKLEFNSRIRSLLPLNSDWTQFLAITDAYFSVMVLNETLNRFDEVTRISGYFRSIALDDLDRIWTLTMEGKVGIMSPYVPTRVSVTMEQERYNYTGTPITTFVKVSAFDILSARIAVSVNIVIDAPGSTVTFLDGTKSKTVTTLTNGDLTVQFVINSATLFRFLTNTGV